MPHKQHGGRMALLRGADARRGYMDEVRSKRPSNPKSPQAYLDIEKGKWIVDDDDKLTPEMREGLVLALICTVIGILMVFVGVAILKMVGVL